MSISDSIVALQVHEPSFRVLKIVKVGIGYHLCPGIIAPLVHWFIKVRL